MAQIQAQRPPTKKRNKIITIIALICGILTLTSVFVGYHTKGNEPQIVDQQEPVIMNMNDSCSLWQVTGDEYCDDEANIVECRYDLQDCCHIESDRSLCTDCLCYIPKEEKILLDDEYSKSCPYFWAGGDGLCDSCLNNREHYFDVGDCCLENPICPSFTTLFYISPDIIECPENPCIQSNIFCISEELGDGICQDHNNGPFCQYDLGDCCLVPGNFTSCSCNCECKNDIFIYDYDSFMQTNVAGIKGIKD